MKHHNGRRSRRANKSLDRWQRDGLPMEDSYGEELDPRWSDDDEEALESERRFDLLRWREDLEERSRHRARLRERELRKGALRRTGKAPPAESEDDF